MGRFFHIVANPYSGNGRAYDMLKKLKVKLDAKALSYTSFITPRSENLYEFIEENLPECTTDVVVIGGEGTINATLNAIYNKDLLMGFIPVDSGNDFIKMIDVGPNINEHIETTISGKEKIIDIGDCNGRKFINGVGIGFDGQIVYNMIKGKSIFTGYAKYYYHVLKIIWTYRSRIFQIDMDGQNLKMNIIMMAIHNGTTFGGSFQLNPLSKVDDGFFNVCPIGSMPSQV